MGRLTIGIGVSHRPVPIDPATSAAASRRRNSLATAVRHFVQQFSRNISKAIDTIPSDTMTTLVRYSWPGNIRELQNVIERAVILTKGPVLRVPSDDLHSPIAIAEPPHANLSTPPRNMRAVLDDAERQQIMAMSEQTNWTVAGPNGAASRLGMKRSTLQSRMQKLGIRISRTGA